jgi:hypothetical protein
VNTPQDRELDRLLDASADVIGWDDPIARERIRGLITEPCDKPQCPFCSPPAKDEPMSTIDKAWTVAKAAVLIWAVAVVVSLAAAMVFGQDLP